MVNQRNLDYKVVKKLGSGGFADVYCVEQIVSKQLFAAKMMRDKYNGSDSSNEIAVMLQLQHQSNVLQLIEHLYDSSTQQLILILELMDMNLHQYLNDRRKPLTELKAKKIFCSILKAVHYIHSNGFFHRDIKPENILLKLVTIDETRPRQLIVKLADFGCTKQFRNAQKPPPYTEYMATRWYRAPECILTNGFYGPKMDVWALGCVFYEILMLKPLFPGNNEIDQLHKIHMILGMPSSKMLAKYKQKFGQINFKNTNSTTKTTSNSIASSYIGVGGGGAGGESTASANNQNSKGIGLQMIMFNVSSEAIKILTQMLAYDPDKRTNIQRIILKPYFEQLLTTTTETVKKF